MFRQTKQGETLWVTCCYLTLLAAPQLSLAVEASGGVWGNYAYTFSEPADSRGWGELGDGALTLYLDDQWLSGTWSASAEARFGPGSFTDPDNNFTGAYATLHKAWIAWTPDPAITLTLGKSSVPFAWKTFNFWPGDLHMAGYGDQMDLGLKASASLGAFLLDAAWYHADDFGPTSTDTVDDNGHWGSSTTFRKARTWVGQARWQATTALTLGIAYQDGELENLAGESLPAPDGDHHAATVFVEFTNDPWFSRLALYDIHRTLPDRTRVSNQRAAFELGWASGPWAVYLDASMAHPESPGNKAGTISAWAPGMRYDYGPGWIYVEALLQDGDIDRAGVVQPGDFEALYVSIDFYF